MQTHTQSTFAPAHAIAYRKDIDGLRAVAILAVLIFHLNYQWLPGGFLGVDIFFVISGFLITSIIYTDICQQRFSFANFYHKRIRRILPAFFFVMFSTLLLAYLLLDKGSQIDTARSALESIKFIVNFYFARKNGYFDDTHEMPLLHFWSLAVEEQFYFIFPVLLIGILKSQRLRQYLLPILSLCLLLSMASQFIEIKQEPYYLFHLRAGELLVGSILAIYSAKGKAAIFAKPHVNLILSSVGFIALFACFILFDKNTPLFPAISGLVPCLFAALVILCSQSGNWVQRILSHPIMVFIGKISYSLYLWHWVVLAFMRYIYGSYDFPTSWIPIFVALTLLLSLLTFYCIETPFRKTNLGFKKSFLYFYLVPSIILFGAYRLIKKEETLSAEEKMLMYPTEICHDNNWLSSCKKGDLSKDANILFAGDSHTGHLNDFIDLVGKNEGWAAEVFSTSACYYLLNYQPNEKSFKPEECAKYNQYISSIIDKYQTIVFTNYWGEYKNKPVAFIENLEKTLVHLLSKGKKVYIINSSYNIGFNPMNTYRLKNKGLNLDYRLSDEKTKQIYFDGLKKVEDIVKKYPQIHYVDLTAYLPNPLVIDDKPIFEDSDHWNRWGATKIAEKFIAEGGRLIQPEH